MKDNKVVITYKKGPFSNAFNALSGLDCSRFKGKSILIKPNVGRLVPPGKGITVHPDAISGVVEALIKAGAGRIAIGESPIVGIDTMEAFTKTGTIDVSRRYNIPLIDLDSEKPVKKAMKDGRILKETKICSQIYNFDLILSMPVAKTHMHTSVTLGIKNMKGCLYKYEKVRYHQLEYEIEDQFPEKTLDTAISDLATILLPDLTVIDGYIGMEGLGPSGGEPILSDFAVASWNPVGADYFGCVMMGIDPCSVMHLVLTANRLGYSMEKSDYQVLSVDNTDYNDHIIPYKNPPDKFTIAYPDVVFFDKESCSACLSTVMLFLKRFRSDMSSYLFPDGKFYIAIGKGVKEDEIPEGTYLVGNCTRKCHLKGKFIPGCPPVPTRLYEAITGTEPDENEPDVK